MRRFENMMVMALVVGLMALVTGPAAPSAAQQGTPQALAGSPLDQLNALLATPFPAALLPDGLHDPAVQQWTNYNDSDLTGTVGGVQISLNGDPSTGIYYLIYPDAATGEQYFTANRSSGGTVIPTVPSTSANQGERIQLSYASGAVCVELTANVTVIGAVGSKVQVADPGKSACDLVDAGITNLDTVTLIQPVPIPVAQVPPTPLDRLNALLATPFPADLLPAGHRDPVTNQWRYGDQDLQGAIGGLNISLDGDQTTGIGYIVFPQADRAAAYVSAIGASMGTPVASGTPVTEFRAALDRYAVCVGVSDVVVIIGARTMADGTSGPDAVIDACALRDAGLTWLGTDAAPVATPAAVIDTTVLYNALSSSAMPLERLPPGTTSVSYSLHSNVDDAYGLVGSVFATVSGQEGTGISFLVYPDPETA